MSEYRGQTDWIKANKAEKRTRRKVLQRATSLYFTTINRITNRNSTNPMQENIGSLRLETGA